MKLLKFILPFLLITFLSNSIFATVSHEGTESREISYSARKLGLKAKEEFQLFTKLAGNNRDSCKRQSHHRSWRQPQLGADGVCLAPPELGYPQLSATFLAT